MNIWRKIPEHYRSSWHKDILDYRFESNLLFRGGWYKSLLTPSFLLGLRLLGYLDGSFHLQFLIQNLTHNRKYDYLVIEVWVVFWVAVEILSVMLAECSGFHWVIWYRYIILIISWLNKNIFGTGPPISSRRFLILNLISYVEVWLIFSYLSFVHKTAFSPEFCSIGQSMRYSIGILTTMGSNFEPATTCGGILFGLEVLAGLLFILVVIPLVVSLFRR